LNKDWIAESKSVKTGLESGLEYYIQIWLLLMSTRTMLFVLNPTRIRDIELKFG